MSRQDALFQSVLVFFLVSAMIYVSEGGTDPSRYPLPLPILVWLFNTSLSFQVIIIARCCAFRVECFPSFFPVHATFPSRRLPSLLLVLRPLSFGHLTQTVNFPLISTPPPSPPPSLLSAGVFLQGTCFTVMTVPMLSLFIPRLPPRCFPFPSGSFF